MATKSFQSGLPQMKGDASMLKVRSADSLTVEALARGHQSALLRYFKKRGIREQDAEDAVQEVFFRLSRRQGLSEIERIEGYLFETAANVAIDALRHNRVRRSESHDVYDESRHGRPECSSEAVFEGQEAIEQLLLALRELPDRTRTVFILARLEHIKQSEIAHRLGISVSAVEKQLTKGLAYLALRTSMP
jgi:RNA polymerase sigma-70 factor (ECF subfamily)